MWMWWTGGAAAGPDITAPTVVSRVIPAAGTTLVVTFNETVTHGAGGSGGNTLATFSGGAVTPTYSSGQGSTVLTYSLSRTIGIGETDGTHSYTQPTNGIEDVAGNDLVSFSTQVVTNNSTQDLTAPTMSTVTIGADGETVTVVYSENVVAGSGDDADIDLTSDGGAVVMTYVSGTGTNTHTYTLDRVVESDETVTLDYTQPGNGIEDSAGNDLATINDKAVVNDSEQGGAPTNRVLREDDSLVLREDSSYILREA